MRKGTSDKIYHGNMFSIDTIFSLMQNLSREHVQRMAAILWSMWKHRNLKLWENENELCANVVDRARHLIGDWKYLQLFTLEV